jgi:hypothetical protein
MPLPSTPRVRKHRDRQRHGRIVLRIEVDEVNVADWLAATGFLPPGSAADDRTAVAEALRVAIEVFSRP